jgi:8-oxo-dGTP diphosphatase
VAAGVIWRDGRFLAAKRPEGKPWAGFWEFPGGKREAGESMVETLSRELREELGITCVSVLPWRTVAQDYPGQRIRLHLLHVTAFTGTPFARDGQELRWVTPEEARALSFLPADRELVAILAPPLIGAHGATAG